MRKRYWLLLILIALVIGYLSGPRPADSDFRISYDQLDIPVAQLDDFVKQSEAQYDIKPDNQARIIWADSIGQKSNIAFIYLHGMGASPMEGDPLHTRLAEHYSANLYLARLYGHGLQGDDLLLDFTPDKYLASVTEAISIGEKLGDTIVILSCSTGSTGALYTTGNKDNIAAQLLYSPNIDVKDPSSKLLTKPWGLQLARKVVGGENHTWDNDDPEVNQYWYTSYRLEALVSLKDLIENTMNKQTFAKIDEPVFVAYYNKNEEEQDQVVSVTRIEEMFEQLGTPADDKRLVNFPEGGNHGLLNRFFGEDVENVIQESIRFIDEEVRSD